jgi:hypothetical protein
LFDFLKAPASLKTSLLMKQVLKAPREIVPQMSLQVDYVSSLPAAPDAAAYRRPACGDPRSGAPASGNATVDLTTFGQWQSVGGSGYAIAPACQITSGNIVPPDVELVRVDFTYDQGDIVS